MILARVVPGRPERAAGSGSSRVPFVKRDTLVSTRRSGTSRRSRICASLVLSLAFTGAFLPAACSKKAEPGREPAPAAAEPPEAQAGILREKVLAALKKQSSEAQKTAVDKASDLAESDPAVTPALVELLRDKGTAGSGRRLANRPNSTREAAARALVRVGPAGEAALQEKGIAILREGLADPAPAVREHTAYTLGILGDKAKPAADGVFKLCTDADPNVRAAAFDALRAIGFSDAPAMTRLLAHGEADVRRRAAESLPKLDPVPAAALAPLTAAVGDDDRAVRTAALAALTRMGAPAAPAAPAVAAALLKRYPAKYDPESPPPDEAGSWQLLSQLGEASVKPLQGLLGHSNTMVRGLATQTLGEIGPAAKPAADDIKKLFDGPDSDVAFAAAVALCRIGAHEAEAVEFVKRGLEAARPEVVIQAMEAAFELGDRGRPLYPNVFAKLASDKPVLRAASLRFLGELDVTEAEPAVPAVAKLLADKDAEVRQLAGRLVGRLGPAAAGAAEAMGQALTAEKDAGVRELFVAALAAMGPGAKAALPGLLAVAADAGAGEDLRLAALRAAAAAAPDSAAVAAALQGGAADESEGVRLAAAEALGRLRPLPPAAAGTLAGLMRGDKAYRVRQAAVRALAEAVPPAKASRADLEAVAAGPNRDLAFWAKVALAGLDGDPTKAAPLVRAALADPSVRTAALEALPLVGPPQADDLPGLVKLLKDRTAGIRARAAAAVGRYGPTAKGEVPQLKAALADTDDEVRVAAANALGAIGPDAADAADALKAVEDDPAVGKAAREARGKIGAGEGPRKAKKK